MFKCFDSQEQREIIILDTEWDGDRLTQLRAKGQTEILRCPECKQPVHVKAGERRAWHFAHNDLGSCPLHSESPAILKARGRLYHWLVSKFTEREGLSQTSKATVTVEMNLSGDLPRPVDCVVTMPSGTRLAYWVFERGMRDRGVLRHSLEGVTVHAVFLTSMMRSVPNESGSFDLTPTERDFMVNSEYDAVYAPADGSLHYLDQETGSLTTLRGLLLEHAPQRYSARTTLVHPLLDIMTNQTGMFVHPGEHERLREHRRIAEGRRMQEEDRRKNELARQARWRDETAKLGAGRFLNTVHNPLEAAAAEYEAPPKPGGDPTERESLTVLRAMGREPVTCERCGKQTTNWVKCVPDKGTCLCRECVDREATSRERL